MDFIIHVMRWLLGSYMYLKSNFDKMDWTKTVDVYLRKFLFLFSTKDKTENYPMRLICILDFGLAK